MKMKNVGAKKKIIRRRLTRELRALGIPQESDESSEETRPSRSKMTRELRSMGTTPPAEEFTSTTSSSNKEESPGEIHSDITSDPGVPTTFEEKFFGPMSHVWRPAIYEFYQLKSLRESRQETCDRTTKKKAHDPQVDFQRKNKSRWNHQIQGKMRLKRVHVNTWSRLHGVICTSGIR
jgi:hypothetical protein